MPNSPRRSSRAMRGITQPPTQPTHSNSASSSSTSSQRAERNTRSNNKQESPQKSSSPNSLSSDELSEHAMGELPQTRRSKRQQDHEGGNNARADEEMDDETAEGEGAIRCICGFPDYPGPALEGQPDAQIDFVMCDSCNQWQHGGCVGIFDESTNPEEYFCEVCRPNLHQVARGRDGQKYSRYLPIFEKLPSKSSSSSSSSQHRKASGVRTAVTKVVKDKDKSARATIDSLTKRRSTMNSRAAYDEEEVLRKVLEESKSEGLQGQDTASRKSKRSRDESEDARLDAKRRRTRSDTPSSSRSDEAILGAGTDPRRKGEKKATVRGPVVLGPRDKELQDRERERAAAASKRQGRADRRRGDDSDPTEEASKPVNGKSPQEDQAASQPPDTPASSTTNNLAPRRGGRQGGKRGGRGGRTAGRDQETPAINDSGSPTRKTGKTSGSPNDVNGDGPASGAESATGGGNNGVAAGKKGKHQQQRDPSMAELKKKAATMMEYITQTQMELARWNDRGVGSVVPKLRSETTDEMTKQMGELSTKLVKWQEEYGKWPEK